MSNFDSIFSTAFNSVAPSIYGDTVSLTREDVGTNAGVIAMISDISTDQKLEWGASLTTSSREYVIAVENYTINSTALEPARNDLFTETVNGVERFYEVTNIGNSAAWEFTDTKQEYYRIRTVEVFGS